MSDDACLELSPFVVPFVSAIDSEGNKRSLTSDGLL